MLLNSNKKYTWMQIILSELNPYRDSDPWEHSVEWECVLSPSLVDFFEGCSHLHCPCFSLFQLWVLTSTYFFSAGLQRNTEIGIKFLFNFLGEMCGSTGLPSVLWHRPKIVHLSLRANITVFKPAEIPTW